jgi:hypothetical protein
MILAYNSNNSNNLWACKHLIHFYSTVYRSEKMGGPGGCPPGNTSLSKDKTMSHGLDAVGGSVSQFNFNLFFEFRGPAGLGYAEATRGCGREKRIVSSCIFMGCPPTPRPHCVRTSKSFRIKIQLKTLPFSLPRPTYGLWFYP